MCGQQDIHNTWDVVFQNSEHAWPRAEPNHVLATHLFHLFWETQGNLDLCENTSVYL